MTTLHEIFAKYHIHRSVDLAKRVGLSRQYAHLLWTGHRPISRRMPERIAASTKIPYTALLRPRPRRHRHANPAARRRSPMSERDRDHTPASLASQDDGTLCRVPTTILDSGRADRCGWSDGNITIHAPEEA